MSLIKNKQGGEKLLSIWWFFVLAVIGTGIVVGVVAFYSAEIDVRQVAAEVLTSRISGCIDNLMNVDFDIYKECHINQTIFEDGDYFVKIQVLDKDGKEIRDTIQKGAASFEADCQVIGGVTGNAKFYPACSTKEVAMPYGKVIILTAVNQNGNKIR